ncbi:hypothetical protein BJ165DRAFT_1609925 [Panaeolus papilionaceus]|nr:hypothetical protein BJ165DRAFT_1609925 [Panaeolus papilionaceus]
MAVKMIDAVNILGFGQAVSGTINALQNLAIYHYGFTRPTQDPRKAPILSLPAEIICQILKDSLEPGRESFRPCNYPIVSEGCRRSPIELSHVCIAWRDIVNNAPELWDHITFLHTSYRQLEPTAHWLARLGESTPLTISLYQFADHPGIGNDDSLGPLLNLLMTKAHLWHMIDFRLNGTVKGDVMETLSRIQTIASPMLADARISINPQNPAVSSTVLPIFSAWDAFRKVPTLSAFCWRAPFTPGTNYASHLRILEINSPISVEVLVENLQSCPLLEMLNVDKIELESDSIEVDPAHMDIPCEAPPLVVLPHLLHLHLNSKVLLHDILTRLHTPSLHILQIAGLDVRERQHVIGMLKRNNHVLSNLGLQFVSTTAQGGNMPLSAEETKDYLDDLYPFIEHVQSLHILGGTFDFQLVEVFKRPMTTELECEDVFPELRNLGISQVTADVDDGVILRMLGSRFWDFKFATKQDVPLLEAAKIHVDSLTDEMEKYVNMISRCGNSGGIARTLEIHSS